MTAILHGNVDALLFTGGMAHWQQLTTALSAYTSWIAPIRVTPARTNCRRLRRVHCECCAAKKSRDF